MKPFLAFLVCLLITITPAAANTHGVMMQTTPTDCGPAALATLLHYYLDIPTTEREIARLSGHSLYQGTTLLDLEKAATAKRCAAGSFRMSYSTLKEQLATYAPVIVRTLNPEPHFSVLLAIEGNYIYLADPASGNIVLRESAFLKRWCIPGAREGFVFLAATPDQKVNTRRITRTLAQLRQSQQNLQGSYFEAALVRR
jgi:predicted double-glycine peptidase